MRTLRGALAVAAAVAAAVVAIPGSASAVTDGGFTQFKKFAHSDVASVCLGVDGGDSKVVDGRAVIVYPCDGTRNQNWVTVKVDPNSANWFIKNSVNTNECLSVQAKSRNALAHLVIWPCKGSSDNQDQQWSFSSEPRAPYSYVQNFWSGLYMSPQDDSVFTGVWQVPGPPSGPWYPLTAWLTS